MLIETVIATFLFACLVCFFSFNLYNSLVVHKPRGDAKVYAEVGHPSGLIVSLAAVGTLVYFLEALLYLFLVFTDLISALCVLPFYFQLAFVFYMQIFGIVLTLAGYFLFIWSVAARGIYAVSWEMPEKQKLVTWGPYQYVRHPSYLGYFLMFFGLFFSWPSFFTLFPLAAVPGYYRVTIEEERLLTQRFGNEYLEYRKRTGRFFPRLL
jgi:protein-S-isoprenylcysteine O-methyltransferase Ste14